MGEVLDLGLRTDVAAHVKRSVKTLMHMIIEDRIAHAECVAAGRFYFRAAFNKDMGPFFLNNRAGCDSLADITYNFFDQHWKRLYPGIPADKFLDSIEPVSAPTEREIDEAWELEIGSSESAMRGLYEGSARVRKGADLGIRQSRPDPVKN